MKKLMLLGGSRYILPVIRKAHEYGVHVITCDYLPENIAHKYSDEYCNESVVDKKQILKCSLEMNIDGIMSFACDPGVVTAAYVAEKMGLPSCGPYKSVDILQNKGKFRNFLSDNGFNVPKAKTYTSTNDALADIKNLSFPAMVKPVDSAGSKGVRKIMNSNELPNAVEYALSKSLMGEIIIEDYIEQFGNASDCDSFSIDGKIVCWNMNDQLFDENADNPFTPAGFIFPSSMKTNVQNQLKSDIQRLLTKLEMKTSLYNIEARVDQNGKAYIMECSPRAGGNRLAEMVRHYCGIDMIDMAVRAAIGMEVLPPKLGKAEGYLCEVILHSNKAGYYKDLKIADSIRDSIVEMDIWPKQGEIINRFCGANDSIGTVVLSFSNRENAYDVMNRIQEYIEVVTN